MADVTTLAVWEKQADETPKSYAGFCVYRDQGITRSLSKAAAEFYVGDAESKPKPSQLNTFKGWSRKYRWAQRVAAWDVEEDRKNRLKRQKAAEDARDRAIRGAQLAQRIGLLGMKQVSERFGNAEERPSTNLLKFWETGVQWEFTALGLPVHLIKQEIEENVVDPADAGRRELLNRAGDALRRR